MQESTWSELNGDVAISNYWTSARFALTELGLAKLREKVEEDGGAQKNLGKRMAELLKSGGKITLQEGYAILLASAASMAAAFLGF